MKKLAAIAVATVLCGAAFLPASAAVTANGSVTVRWNTAIAATLTLATNYDAGGLQQLTAPAIITNANGGGGSCTAAGTGAEVAGTVNFGSITPDFVQSTNCMYKNAVNALVKTNSVSWTLTQTLAAPAVVGSTLCALANDAGNSFPFPAVGALAATQSIAAHNVAFINGTTCPAAGLTVVNGSNVTAANSTTAYPGGANIGEDYELLLGTTSVAGVQAEIVNYQLIAN